MRKGPFEVEMGCNINAMDTHLYKHVLAAQGISIISFYSEIAQKTFSITKGGFSPVIVFTTNCGYEEAFSVLPQIHQL